MKKTSEVLRMFIKDKLPVFTVYFFGNGLIILFYYLIYGNSVEMCYPLLMSASVFFVYILISFVKYYHHVKLIYLAAENRDYSPHSLGCLEKYTAETLRSVHYRYMNELSTITNQQKKDERILSAWVHNMKTPVSVSDLLLQRYEKDEIDKEYYISAQREENSRQLSLLNGMLDIHRLKEFNKDYEPEALDLGQLITNAINQNRKTFIYNNVYPKYTKEEPVYVLTDSKWNLVLLTQVISNAVKYSKGDQAHNVYFSIDKKGKYTELHIRDEGKGIPEYDLAKVFEPFFTGDNGRNRMDSSGIGLYFCHEICNMLGQQISIESQEGTGTCVTITYLSKL